LHATLYVFAPGLEFRYVLAMSNLFFGLGGQCIPLCLQKTTGTIAIIKKLQDQVAKLESD
jgi:hypothetical protein